MRYRIVDEATGRVVANFETLAEARRFDEILSDEVWWDFYIKEEEEVMARDGVRATVGGVR